MIGFVTDADSDEQPTGSEDRLEELPASAKLVYYVLDEEGQLTQTDLAEQARLPIRTTRAALATLTERGLVSETLCVLDARKKLYRTADADDESALNR